MIGPAYWSQILRAASLAAGSQSDGPEALAALLYEAWFAPAPVAGVTSAEAQRWSRLPEFARESSRASRTVAWGSASPPGASGTAFVASPTEVLAATPRRNGVWIAGGDWYTCSPTWPDRRGTILDVYVACRAPEHPQVIERLISVLDESVPYQIRCPIEPERALRPGGVSLSLPGAFFRALSRPLSRVPRALPSGEDPSPMFTRPLAPGLAIAEQPPGGTFGRHRSRILAYGMWPRRSAGGSEPTALAADALGALLREGITLDAPYRNPGSTADYGV